MIAATVAQGYQILLPFSVLNGGAVVAETSVAFVAALRSQVPGFVEAKSQAGRFSEAKSSVPGSIEAN